MSWGALSFLAPLTFLGLLALPIIWWIMKVTPPKPRRQSFPPLRILLDVQTDEETPDTMPLWLLLFRMFLVALTVFALAQPLLKSSDDQTARPLTLIIDQSVTAAPIWDNMIAAAETHIKTARRNNMDVQLILSGEDKPNPNFVPAAQALRELKSLQPAPYITYYEASLRALETSSAENSETIWLSSGLIADNQSSFIDALADRKAKIYSPDVQRVIMPSDIRETANGFDADWHRPSLSTPSSVQIEAVTNNNQVLAIETLNFDTGAQRSTVSMSMPAQLRAKVTQLRVQGLRASIATKLLGDSFGRPLIGVLTPPANTSSPLLSEPFYSKQALLPYADIFEGNEEELLALQPSIIVMPDSMRSDSEAISNYVETGGLLVRFAGPQLAKRQDSLLPVSLRSGGRAIGGALAWEDPQRLAPFPEESPFFGLSIPSDVTVSKQVMAEPGVETDTRTWAKLEDGSPIVTSAVRGNGRIVLFHVSAGPDWSNLPINGLYVDMLRRILPLAKGRSLDVKNSEADWVLDRVIDPFGRLVSAPLREQRLTNSEFNKASASAQHLPGYYRQGTRQRALPVTNEPDRLITVPAPNGTAALAYSQNKPQSLTGRLLGLAAILLVLDVLFSLWISGRFRNLRPRMALSLLLAGVLVLPATIAHAQTPPDRVLEAASGLHLAYIETGDSRQDDLSRTALESLSIQLALRTTIEPEGVHGVAPDADGLEMYPFLYWPIRRDAAALTPKAAAALNTYMRSGGTIVFDTADEGERNLRAGQPHPGLKRVTESLDIPSLTTVPDDHVLTKSFYLTQVFAGRWANGPVYVQAGSNSSGGRDGVSPVIIGSQDWAAGWAIDPEAGTLIELNNDIPRQREMSVRFGINLAMYTLSGNYKADQVHAATLIERLGRNRQAVPTIEEEDKP